MAKSMFTSICFKSTRPIHTHKLFLNYLRHYSTKPTKIKHDPKPNNLYNERRPWSEQDTEILLDLVRGFGHAWKILTRYFPGRNADTIKNHYMAVKHGQKSLTLKEKNMVQELVREQDAEKIDWNHVQQSLPQIKPVGVIQKYYRNSIQPDLNKGRWTADETRQLLDLVDKYGKDWVMVSKQLKTRSQDQCSRKYAYEMRMRTSKMGRFSKEEDKALIDAVEQHGTESFYKIKEELNSPRTPKQLRERYKYFLDPSIDKTPWTPEEKQELFDLYAELENVKLLKENVDSKRSLVDLRNSIYYKWKKNKNTSQVLYP